jgi:hypothetical protein
MVRAVARRDRRHRIITTDNGKTSSALHRDRSAMPAAIHMNFFTFVFPYENRGGHDR